MITTLENLDKAVKENRLRNLAENIVKYQNFKTSEILRIIDNAGYSKVSLEAFINAGINYVHTGKKISKRGNLYKFIDDALNKHIQLLTPKEIAK